MKKDLEKVKKTRDLQRGARKKIPYPIVALVGYTNVGKSSIFNNITKADVFVENLLFATLDPTMRKVTLPSGMEVIFSDTVGFISDLPHELVMSFRATLEEVLEADVIIHVRDVTDEDGAEHKKDVLGVLTSLGLEDIEHSDRYFEVFNKIDLIDIEDVYALKNSNNLLVSAHNGKGIDVLLAKIDEKLSKGYIAVNLSIDAFDGKKISWIHENSKVINVKNFEDKVLIKAEISEVNYAKYKSIFEDGQKTLD